MNLLLDLFLTFFKIGLFTFGGGYAMISLIENIFVEKKNWISHEDMMNITVIAESTPGPVAINCSTFVGFRQKGLPGAVMATLGVTFPSFCIILFISMYLDHFREIAWVAHAFWGIKCAVGILILDAALKMISKMHKNILSRLIMAGSFAVMLLIDIFALHISTVALMLTAAVVSLSVSIITKRVGNGGDRT